MRCGVAFMFSSQEYELWKGFDRVRHVRSGGARDENEDDRSSGRSPGAPDYCMYIRRCLFKLLLAVLHTAIAFLLMNIQHGMFGGGSVLQFKR